MTTVFADFSRAKRRIHRQLQTEEGEYWCDQVRKITASPRRERRPIIVPPSPEDTPEETSVCSVPLPCLNTPTISNPLAYFHRSEIVVGRLLGQGTFSNVFEVSAFALCKKWLDQYQNDCTREEASAMRQYYKDHARQPRSGQARYVIKHLSARLLATSTPEQFQTATRDLVMEAQQMMNLDHPFILKIRGLSMQGTSAMSADNTDSYFLLQERLSETLAERIQSWKQRRLQLMLDDFNCILMTKARYALQIAQALQYLHERKIIFRDLKPENLGFRSHEDANSAGCEYYGGAGGDCIQLFDFGLSRKLPNSRTQFGDPNPINVATDTDEVFHMSMAGTRRYMAVEVAQHKPYNLKADVYSWALVFYEMVTEAKPFAEFSREDHDHFVCKMGARPDLSRFPASDLPPELKDLWHDAWHHNLHYRSTMDDVCDQLSLILINWEAEEVAWRLHQVAAEQERLFGWSRVAANHGRHLYAAPPGQDPTRLLPPEHGEQTEDRKSLYDVSSSWA